MSAWLLSLIAIVVIALSVLWGYRQGFYRQIPRLIGIAFGAVAAHIFANPAADTLREAWPRWSGITESQFIYSTVGCGLVFIAVFLIFTFATSFVGWAFRKDERSIFDGIGGAVTSLFIYLIFLSLAYNFLICLWPRSALSESLKTGDGNIIQEVLYIAPSVIGSQSPDTLIHLQQLEDASKIS